MAMLIAFEGAIWGERYDDCIVARTNGQPATTMALKGVKEREQDVLSAELPIGQWFAFWLSDAAVELGPQGKTNGELVRTVRAIEIERSCGNDSCINLVHFL